MGELLFGDSRWVQCPRCGKGHLAKTGCDCWRRAGPPSNAERAAYYAAHGSVPEQIERQSRLWRVVDFGVLAVFRVVGALGRVIGRVKR